jgi:hypothetical protein
MLPVLLGTTNNDVARELVGACATSHIGAGLSPKVYNLRHSALRKTARKCRLQLKSPSKNTKVRARRTDGELGGTL